jgi:hypothetical protein
MIKRSLLILAIIVYSQIILAQIQTDQKTTKKFGLGLLIEHYELGDVTISNIMSAPINKLVFTFSSNHFRIEPELGLRLKKRETNVFYQFTIGNGIFGIYNFKKITFYGGLRFNLAIGCYNLQSYKITQSRKSVSPVLGAEYLVCSHLSLGGEFSIKYTSTESSSIYADIIVPEEKKNTSLTGIVIRYYF